MSFITLVGRYFFESILFRSFCKFYLILLHFGFLADKLHCMNQCRIWKYFTIHWIYLGECLDQWIAFYHIGYHLNSLEEKNVMLYIWKTGRLQNCAAKLPPFCKVVFLTSSAIAGDVFQKNFNGCVRDLIPVSYTHLTLPTN